MIPISGVCCTKSFVKVVGGDSQILEKKRFNHKQEWTELVFTIIRLLRLRCRLDGSSIFVCTYMCAYKHHLWVLIFVVYVHMVSGMTTMYHTTQQRTHPWKRPIGESSGFIEDLFCAFGLEFFTFSVHNAYIWSIHDQSSCILFSQGPLLVSYFL